MRKIILLSIFLSVVSTAFAQRQDSKDLIAEAKKFFDLSRTAEDIIEAEQDVLKGVEFLKRAAESGDADAQVMLAELYVTGQLPPGVEGIDPLDLYFKAAVQGNEAAILSVVPFFLRNGPPYDNEKAGVIISSLEKISTKKPESVAYQLALLNFALSKKDQFDEQFSSLLELADSGNVFAQFYTGRIYLDDYKIGFQLGIPQNIDRGIKYLELAANGGHTQAQQVLGEMYWYGDLVSKDVDKGFKYFEDAAAGGDAENEMYVGAMYYELGRSDVDYEKAFKWLSRAAQKGHRQAQFYLGQMYSFGKGVPKDEKKAEELLQQSVLP